MTKKRSKSAKLLWVIRKTARALSNCCVTGSLQMMRIKIGIGMRLNLSVPSQMKRMRNSLHRSSDVPIWRRKTNWKWGSRNTMSIIRDKFPNVTSWRSTAWNSSSTALAANVESAKTARPRPATVARKSVHPAWEWNATVVRKSAQNARERAATVVRKSAQNARESAATVEKKTAKNAVERNATVVKEIAQNARGHDFWWKLWFLQKFHFYLVELNLHNSKISKFKNNNLKTNNFWFFVICQKNEKW